MIAAFGSWIFFCRDFFFGRKWLEVDAPAYFGHFAYLIKRFMHGDYPLWFPMESGGVPNEFYLRRICEFNPAYGVLLFLHWGIGVDFNNAYLVFMAFYFFLGCCGFYLLCRALTDRQSALTGFFFLLFSPVGTRIFFCFSVLLAVPLIWFFYFFTAWNKKFRVKDFLGLTLCVIILFGTYLPFYFITIASTGLLASALVYGGGWTRLSQNYRQFFLRYKWVTALCGLLVFASIIPGYRFWQLGKNKEIMLPARQKALDTAGKGTAVLSGPRVESSAQVKIQSLGEQGVLVPVLAQQLFADMSRARISTVFFSYFVCLLVLLAVGLKTNRRIGMLLIWFFLLFVIAQNTGTPVYPFLYKHVFFFKYFRNAYHYIWIFFLPMIFLFGAIFLQELCRGIAKQKRPFAFLVYLVAVHAGFVIFLLSQGNQSITAYLTVILSLIFFVLLCLKKIQPGSPSALLLIFIMIFFQSAAAFQGFSKNYPDNWRLSPPGGFDVFNYSGNTGTNINIYYSTTKYLQLHENIDPGILKKYFADNLVFYDRVQPTGDGIKDFKLLESLWRKDANVALVPGDYTGETVAAPFVPAHPQPVTGDSFAFQVTHFDSNSVTFKIKSGVSKFLVYNDAFDPKWVVRINGRKAPLLRANLAFKGVWVPAGDNVVAFRYEDPFRFWIGCFLIYAAYAVLFAVCWLACRDKFFPKNNHFPA
ncbi:MAG: hypothetical protein HQL23_00025 [Candidatus Omnitrophica bacterium]|nr:hypothetical protein [Candidatus Omnitrophota bacterium]